MDRKIGYRIEELILIGIIFLNIFDFLEMLPDYIDYIKKIISFTALGYIMYKVSLSSVLFGNKRKLMDLLIVITYFFFIVKNMVGFALSAAEESNVLSEFYELLVSNSHIIQYTSFSIGGMLLILLAFYLAYSTAVKSPSLMHIIHEEGEPPRETGKLIVRFITIFTVLSGFFILVFNLVMEWLTIAVDAPLLMLAIFAYIFIIIRYHKHFGTESLIFKLGNVGEHTYNQFIELFHYRKTIFLGVAGILALHLITEIGNFIIPYIIGLKDVLYFNQLGAGHEFIYKLMIADIGAVQGAAAKASVGAVYSLNAIAMVSLFLMLPVVWYKLFKKHPLHIPRTALSLVYASFISYVLMPAFTLGRIAAEGLVGTDVKTRSIIGNWAIIDLAVADKQTAVVVVACVSIALGLMIYLLEYWKQIKKELFIGSIAFAAIFFSGYIYYFFISIYQYYVATITFLLSINQYFIGLFMVLFLAITLLLYAGGYLLFLFEIWKGTMLYE